jgi:hypothetical protein
MTSHIRRAPTPRSGELRRTRTEAAQRADGELWQAYPKLRWVYDRLQLSQVLEYECGPAGTLPPRPGIWFVKPIINLNGMGVDACAQTYDGGQGFPIRPGSFWMPRFTGRHLSLDLKRFPNQWEVQFAVECIYRNNRPYEWRRVKDRPKLPVLISPDATDIPWLNVEMIGSNVIEVHLRRNHDFDVMPDAYSAFPIWEGEPVPADMVPDPEDADGFLVPRRLGFVYRSEERCAAPLVGFHLNGEEIPMSDRVGG